MDFIKPCQGRLTSGFRTKDRPDHHGMDWAQTGRVEIVAAADGIVSKSYNSVSYGEVVFVLHQLNGQTWETVYAHLKEGSRTVEVNDKVKKGDLLGYMGNTGHSFGQHLHFELHKGRWNFQKTNAVDPMEFIQVPKPKEIVKKKVKFIHLPKTAETWRVYPLDKEPVKGNECAILKPSKFGGLKYEILEERKKDVYIIQTSDFGKVQIYAAAATGAKIK